MTFNLGAAAKEVVARHPKGYSAGTVNPNPKPILGATLPVDANAKAILSGILDAYGLPQLADWAWQTYTNAGGGDLGQQLVVDELPQQAAYKARFPAIDQRVKAGLPAISPTDYINYESTLRDAFLAHGLALPTTGQAFNDIVTGLLVKGVSASEVVNQRIASAFDRVFQAPAEVRQAASQLYGLNSDAALASFFLSPEHSAPELDRISKGLEVAGTASRFGIQIGADRANRLADVGADSNLGAIGQLAQQRALFDANRGEDPNLTMADQGLSAVFNENPEAALLVQRRMAERKAALGGGGEPYTSSSLSATPGMPGLGSGPT